MVASVGTGGWASPSTMAAARDFAFSARRVMGQWPEVSSGRVRFQVMGVGGCCEVGVEAGEGLGAVLLGGVADFPGLFGEVAGFELRVAEFFEDAADLGGGLGGGLGEGDAGGDVEGHGWDGVGFDQGGDGDAGVGGGVPDVGGEAGGDPEEGDDHGAEEDGEGDEGGEEGAGLDGGGEAAEGLARGGSRGAVGRLRLVSQPARDLATRRRGLSVS